MPHMPRDTRLDATAALLREGYTFIGDRCDRLGSDIFETRLLLEKTICMRGEKAARIFYDEGRFTRREAAPPRLEKTLFGSGGVQGLDGARHRRRKAMFMSLMGSESIAELLQQIAEEWRRAVQRWEKQPRVVFFEEVQELLLRATCAWVGVPLRDAEARERARDIGAMIDGAGGAGRRYLRGRLGRQRSEQWIARVVDEVRSFDRAAPRGRALEVVAQFREADGQRLERDIAAVEILNVIRPTVAVARYATFAALALHHHPECRPRLTDPSYRDAFADEVRRFYPFFPFVAARVREAFSHEGHAFPTGRRVLLDLYGTNHDRRIFGDPEVFRPERFAERASSPYSPIPQGGGDHRNHRCAGERITVELIKLIATLMNDSISYTVPGQDLRIFLARVPAIVESRFIIENVKERRLASQAAADLVRELQPLQP